MVFAIDRTAETLDVVDPGARPIVASGDDALRSHPRSTASTALRP
jgi:hypothetical protein